jgi:hypothetical protein
MTTYAFQLRANGQPTQLFSYGRYDREEALALARVAAEALASAGHKPVKETVRIRRALKPRTVVVGHWE